MARRIGVQTYEVEPGIVVVPICGANEKQDGWQIIVHGEYHQDYPLKRDAISEAEAYCKNRIAESRTDV